MESDNSNNDKTEIIAYENTFNVVSNIVIQESDNQKQILLLKIVIKLLSNIVSTELVEEENERYRKIKLSNPNIEKIFKINGIYDYFIYLGFTEKAFDNELYLYLSEEYVDIYKLLIILPYLNLLLLNIEPEINYYDPNESNPDTGNTEFYNINEYNFEDYNKNNNPNNEVQYKKASVIDILKNSKDVRLGKTLILPDNYDKVPIISNNSNKSNNNNNNQISNIPKQIAIKNPYYKPKDGKTFLKETADIRINNSKLYQSENKGIFSFYNYLFKSHKEEKENKEKNKKNQKEKPKVMTLNDLYYQNPENTRICKDEIGKKCLELTNEFRKKNNLPILEWDDEIWRVAYVHSENMGKKKVPFGHDGFNERIKKFRFYYSLAAENVYMCSGYSQYHIAQMGVNGWINSPGHRKNLLSNTSHCAIATYRSGYGEFYLTQIFVRK